MLDGRSLVIHDFGMLGLQNSYLNNYPAGFSVMAILDNILWCRYYTTNNSLIFKN